MSTVGQCVGNAQVLIDLGVHLEYDESTPTRQTITNTAHCLGLGLRLKAGKGRAAFLARSRPGFGAVRRRACPLPPDGRRPLRRSQWPIFTAIPGDAADSWIIVSRPGRHGVGVIARGRILSNTVSSKVLTAMGSRLGFFTFDPHLYAQRKGKGDRAWRVRFRIRPTRIRRLIPGRSGHCPVDIRDPNGRRPVPEPEIPVAPLA
jgi:hypothetical protein